MKASALPVARSLLAAAAALVALATPQPPAQAHRLSFSKGRWVIDPAAGAVTLELAIDSLAVPPVAGLQPPTGAQARAAWWPAHQAAIQAAFGRGITLVSDGGACARTEGAIETRKGGDMLVMGYRWACRAPIAALRVELGYVNALPSDHKHIARVDVGGRMTLRSFSHATPAWDVPPALLSGARPAGEREEARTVPAPAPGPPPGRP